MCQNVYTCACFLQDQRSFDPHQGLYTSVHQTMRNARMQPGHSVYGQWCDPVLYSVAIPRFYNVGIRQ